MANPYEDFFDNQKNKFNRESPKEKPDPLKVPDPRFPDNQKEPLDEILENIKLFQEKANSFSKLLSTTNAVDHQIDKSFSGLFFIAKDKYDQGSLAKEKKYHALLVEKFERIIQPMKELAQIHLTIVKQFNSDIDDNYYSIEKTDREVKSEKAQAIKNINLQRKILADAAEDLETISEALQSTEKRIRKYIDVGGINNISTAEAALLSANRETMSSGKNFQFDYSFFKLNIIDNTAIRFGYYLKETSSSYLNKLLQAFERKD